MPALDSTPPAAWIVAGFFLFVSLGIYAAQCRRIAQDGGRVRSSALDLPELLMSIVFASFFALMMVAAILRRKNGAEEVSIDAVLPSSFLFIAFTAGIAAFLRYRGTKLTEVFGLDQVGPLQVLGWACGLLLAAFPLCSAASALTLLVFHGKIDPQPLVQLFSNVSQKHDYLAVTKILISGVLIQPVCEEFLFRGFFYGVWKRYLGPLPAGLCACVLFAAFHTSLAAFGGLLVLAVCLNIAYERTGSLLVPIGMHALFNFTSLLAIFVQAQLFGVPS